MRLTWRVLAVVVASTLFASVAHAADDVEKLAEAVRQATSPDEKREAAKALGDLKTDASRAKLLALWSADDGWTKQAAAFALLRLEDDKADAALAEKLEEDVSSEPELVKALKARKKPFPATRLVARLEAATWEPDREKLMETLAATGSPEARAALVGLVRAKGDSPLRAKAFGLLAGDDKAPDLRPLALEVLDDPDAGVAGGALAVIVDGGTAADLPRVRSVLEKRTAEADAPVAVVAYRGVAKWADAKVKLETYLAALGAKDERRAQAAIVVFADQGGAQVESELCRLVRRGLHQETRLGAADRLVSWPAAPAGAPDRVVPALVVALRETFRPEEKDEGVLGGWIKGFANILTLGAVGALESWQRHKTQEAFDASLKKIGEALEQRTGAKLGASAEVWTDWAVEHGHTIDGDNVVARLFSGYPEKRKRALESGARLAGFAGRDDLVAKTPALAGAKESEVALELARKLLAKGLPADEKP